jgi:hypothetical protein
MYVCMNVCTVYMYVCTVCMYVCMYVPYVCSYVPYVCMYVHMYVPYVCMYVPYVCMYYFYFVCFIPIYYISCNSPKTFHLHRLRSSLMFYQNQVLTPYNSGTILISYNFNFSLLNILNSRKQCVRLFYLARLLYAFYRKAHNNVSLTKKCVF